MLAHLACRKDSTVTDDDIDDLIDRGVKKTQEMNKKLESETEEGLKAFKMEEDPNYSLYNFDGLHFELYLILLSN